MLCFYITSLAFRVSEWEQMMARLKTEEFQMALVHVEKSLILNTFTPS